jgi:hypothetical protein
MRQSPVRVVGEGEVTLPKLLPVTLALYFCCAPVDAGTSYAEKFSARWLSARPPGVTPLLIYQSSHGPSEFPALIEHYFEPSSLSKDAHLQCQIALRGDTCTFSKLTGPNTNPTDSFYCEQAILAASPWSPFVDGFSGIFDFRYTEPKLSNHHSCKTLFFKKHSVLRDKAVVVIHVVPCCMDILCPDAVEENELHSLTNLKAIRIKDIGSEQFLNFQKEWNEFFKIQADRTYVNHRAGISRKELLDKADELVDKYSSLFVEIGHLARSGA